MKNFKKEKGITLVALIITIVVLLILAVVAIGAVQDSKIIGHAQKAGSDYTIAQEKEQIGLAISEWNLEKVIQGNNPIFKEVIEGALRESNVSVTGENNGPLTVTFNKTGNQYTIADDGKVEIIPEGIILSATELSIAPGGTARITAKLAGGLTGKVEWESSNTEVAILTISEDGLTATVTVPEEVSIGTVATVTAQCEGYTTVCTITCAIELSDSNYFTYDGGTITGFSTTGQAALAALSGKSVKLVIPAINGSTDITTLGNGGPSGVYMSAYDEIINLSDLSIEAKYIRNLGNKAFEDCPKLISISMDSVTTIGERTFNGCTNLTNISLPLATTIGDNAFSGCTNLTNISLPSATTIGYNAFTRCTNLTNISLPSALTIGGYAFTRCTNITNISLPSATTIGESAFSECTNITNISLPSATTIEAYAFANCTNLKKVEIPSSVTTMGNNVVSDSGITDIYVLGFTKAPNGWDSTWSYNEPSPTVHWNTPMPTE